MVLYSQIGQNILKVYQKQDTTGIQEIENKINSKSIVSYIPQTQTQVDSMALPNYINSLLMAPLKNFLLDQQYVINIGTARYPLAKYLAQNLSPLGQSTYTIKSNFDILGKIKNEQIPLDFIMVSFDFKLLFTSIPLTETIDMGLSLL